jgi:hypothetical protein
VNKLLICLALAATTVGCSGSGRPVENRHAAVCPPDVESNDGVYIWRCLAPQERRDFVAHYVRDPKFFRILSADKMRDPLQVQERRSGFIGRVYYAGASMLSADGVNGWFTIPLIGPANHWALVLWKQQGEYELYRGIRRL